MLRFTLTLILSFNIAFLGHAQEAPEEHPATIRQRELKLSASLNCLAQEKLKFYCESDSQHTFKSSLLTSQNKPNLSPEVVDEFLLTRSHSLCVYVNKKTTEVDKEVTDSEGVTESIKAPKIIKEAFVEYSYVETSAIHPYPELIERTFRSPPDTNDVVDETTHFQFFNVYEKTLGLDTTEFQIKIFPYSGSGILTHAIDGDKNEEYTVPVDCVKL